MLFLSPILGAPELTVPSKFALSRILNSEIVKYSVVVGELPYESKVSRRTEYLPAGLSLMSDPGE